MSRPDALLVLETGRVFRGLGFGATGTAGGEVVFNTSLTGYQEVLTDPSYRGQLVSMTAPQIGNTGVNDDDAESSRVWLDAFIVRELSLNTSSWRATESLDVYLKDRSVVGISDIDTRALTRALREHGSLRGVVSTAGEGVDTLVEKAKALPSLEGRDLVAEVSCTTPYDWTDVGDWVTGQPAGERRRVVAYDFGIKRNILRQLAHLGADLTVVPATTSAADVQALAPDGVFLSNGPGDPAALGPVVREVEKLLGRVPIFGICLGQQVIGQALGARTFKLKFGHHGGNHPVQQVGSGKVEITAQNHGFAVDPDTLPAGAEPTHWNLNDHTLEGFRHRELGLFAVQYHPESSPGPHDSHYLFDTFFEMMRAAKAGKVSDAPS